MVSVEILNAIDSLAQDLPPSLLKDFACENDDPAPFEKFIVTCPASPQRKLLADLLEQWRKENGTRSQIELLDLLVAVSHSLHCHPERKRPEIVWTGPGGKAPFRQTRQVLKELIIGAKRELFIVSYVVFDVPELVAALTQALSRGVRLTCYFEDAEASGGKIFSNAAQNLSREIFAASDTYVWNHEHRESDAQGNIGSLHAKLAIADRRRVFLSSANLTKYALDLNIELGVVFENKSLAEEVISHFEELRERGIFLPVTS